MPVGEIYGTVNRIYDPDRPSEVMYVAEIGGGLFGENVVIRKLLRNALADQIIRRQIGAGNELVTSF